eukprot:CAMPEP_0175072690 /NCGR_PEP_ID=MMETSP0052_2-20121109/20064_1 /TAXON_ID=51329 ORGANISM="Polytomella parva, Strain SAG 63-3" /NCGR_SAMPLE_ID=MMETSP0052_2 /ASSEMBLY_ACC=CAM_ASM_000194 /LENGTH=97 /DNA_ID=CAMNT_0016340251 /DNA_START=62 /DNA_END=351 /DNA_ORIENTATION=+
MGRVGRRGGVHFGAEISQTSEMPLRMGFGFNFSASNNSNNNSNNTAPEPEATATPSLNSSRPIPYGSLISHISSNSNSSSSSNIPVLTNSESTIPTG